ncbi:hypothetical protein E2K93_16190 [Thalassotalea sp. HSM 43]|uniref:hypothetical protein n=1 Tax=Thalassotalea sp. HSM 43 TaxID=2552945 RepID=UPI00108032C0|nr:hypothetical protein [Thalassotalea sp. HSM 43]QBY05807.1 hypothetical protein E2K93_16190 [Thalassotalea sp. HSM 43]
MSLRLVTFAVSTLALAVSLHQTAIYLDIWSNIYVETLAAIYMAFVITKLLCKVVDRRRVVEKLREVHKH